MLDVGGFQYIVTARHVVLESVDNLSISWNGEWQRLPAELVGHCEGDTDISVLRTNRDFPKEVNPDCGDLDTENDLSLGEEVRFYGFPHGIGTLLSNAGHSVALVKHGIVSGFSGGPLTNKRGSILIDGHNNPGFSGGPLVTIRNNNYKVAGVISGYLNSRQKVFDKNAMEEIGRKEVIGYSAENSGIVIVHNIQSALDLMN